MPYSTTSELPQSVRDRYSSKCQRAFMHAFNSVHDETGDEGRAFAAGHSAAQQCEGSRKMLDVTDFSDTTNAQVLVTDASLASPVSFKIYSGLLRAAFDPSDQSMHLMGVASSSTTDLHGDTMLPSALEDMVKAAKNNMTIFLNHSYNVPEDVAGSVKDARLVQRAMDGAGAAIWDLDFDIAVNQANPRAVKAWEAIQAGTKLGLSIGAMIPEGGASRDKKTSAFQVAHVDLLETSIVGIPANPRSWIANAVKALKSAMPVEEIVPDVIDAACGEPCEGGNCKKPKGHGGEHSAMSKGEEPEVIAAVAEEDLPTEEPEDGGDAEEGGSQEAEPSEPETEPADDEEVVAELDADDSKMVVRSMTDALTITETLLARLATAEIAKRKAEEDRDIAIRERDTAVQTAEAAVRQAHAIVERVADSPLVRKAVVRNAQADLSSLERVYAPAVLQLLRGSENK